IDELFNKHYKYMPIFRRSNKIKMILISKIKDKRDEKVREINIKAKEEKARLSAEELVIEENNIEFRRKLEIRDVIREVMKAKDEIDNWIENESVVKIYKDFINTEELSYLDLPAILYLMIKLEGKKSKTEIKHIVIDEAQDYNMLQFIVLKELTGCRSYTIVGDSNQRLIKAEETSAMLKLKDIF
ncbi:AAA family ATPase, partial [Clostridium perfringens]|nr:AAA family ATPase [Clostridium perfringens]